jgi:biopolymer transport protein ExbD
MRIPSSTTDRSASFDQTMTPMIDVVFQLMIFFIVTLNVQAIEYVLPSSIQQTPGSGTATDNPPPPPDFDPVVVKIVWLGDRPGWFVSGQAVKELAQVRATLESAAEIKSDLPVVIDPAGDVPLGDVIDVYDIARLAGFEKIQFAASEDV